MASYNNFLLDITKSVNLKNIFSDKIITDYIIELKEQIIKNKFDKKNIILLNNTNSIYKETYKTLLSLLEDNCYFIDKSIVDNIKTYMNTYIFVYNDIYLLYTINNKISKKDLDDISNYLYIIYTIKKLVRNNKNYILAYGHLTLKIFSKKNDTFNSINCNSGVTFTFGNTNGIILLWRKEELQKVLIHELIHALKIDKNLINNEFIHTKLLKMINIKQNINIFESYTEVLATLLNIIYYSIFNNINNYKIFDLYELELKHSIMKASQILKFKNIRDLNHLIDNFIEFKQNTSVCSYYIIKMILFYNLKIIYYIIK